MADKTLAAANTAFDAEKATVASTTTAQGTTQTADPDGLASAYDTLQREATRLRDNYKKALDRGIANTGEYVVTDIAKLVTMKASIDTWLAAIPARPA